MVSPLLDEHGIAHRVRPEFLVLFNVFHRLLHGSALLVGCVHLSVRFSSELRETHGVIPDAATPVRPDRLFDSFDLLHVGTSHPHGLVCRYRPRFGV